MESDITAPNIKHGTRPSFLAAARVILRGAPTGRDGGIFLTEGPPLFPESYHQTSAENGPSQIFPQMGQGETMIPVGYSGSPIRFNKAENLGSPWRLLNCG